MENNNFIVDNDSKADWAIEKINEHKAERDRLVSICKDRILEFEEKINMYEEQFQRDTEGLKSQLLNYFETVPHKKLKTQESYKLPSGTLKLKYKEKIQKDEEKLKKWLLNANMNEYIEVKEVPKWGDLKKKLIKNGSNYVTEDGEVVEGVEVEDLGGEFVIE